MREIPDAEKPVGHPHLAGSTFLQLAQPGQLSQGGTIRTCARAVGPGKRVNVSLIKPPPKVGTAWRVMGLTFLHINGA